MKTQISLVLAVLVAIITLPSCSTLTDSIAASTQTFTNTTESSSRVSSSQGGEKSAQAQKAVEFAKVNWMQLSANMAKGEGEHLSAMADLLGVKAAQKSAFYSMTKVKFSQLFPSNEVTPEQLVQRLKTEVSQLKA